MSSIRLPHEIKTALDQLGRRSRWLSVANGVLLTTAALLVATLIAIGIDSLIVLFDPRVRVLLTATALACTAIVLFTSLLRPLLQSRPRRALAREIESHVPQLQERWSTVTELSESNDSAPVRGSERLIARVTQEAVELRSAVSPERIATPRHLRVSAASAAVAFLALIVVFAFWPMQTRILLHRFFAPTRALSLTKLTDMTNSMVVPRGDPVRMQARMDGRISPVAQLLLRGDSGQQTLDLRPLDADHSLNHEIRSADGSFEYSFRAGDGMTPWKRVTVADRPSIAQAHFKIIPPAYSRLPVEEKDALPMHERALQGSHFELRLRSTKPLKRLVLTFEDGHNVMLPRFDVDYGFSMTVERSCVFSIRLEDDLGLVNLLPPTCRLTMYEDRPPTVQIVSPTREIAVRPDEKLPIVFDARDDLGIASAELVVTEGEGPEQKTVQVTPIPLGQQEGGKRVHGEAKLDLKPLKLQQGDRLSYAIRVQDTRQASATGERAAGVDTRPSSEQLAQSGADTKPADSQEPNSQQANATTRPAGSPSTDSQPAGAQIAGRNSSSQPALAQNDHTAASQPAGTEQQNGARADAQAAANTQGSQRPPGRPTSRDASDQQASGMTMRQGPGQAAESAQQKLQVDKWAGTFEGQAREKLQIAIDTYIARLDAALAEAQKNVDSFRQPPATAPAEHPPALAKARSALGEADRTVSELRKKSDGTPYAFMGLQLHDIKVEHVAPAQEQLANVAGRSPGAAASAKDVDGAWYHILRAREQLADLNQKYEEIKRQEKISETAERIAQMHRIFVEDMLAMLEGKRKPNLNQRKNKMIEVNKELADAFKEYQEQLKKAEAELAKLLADDPQMLRRFLDRAQVTDLRSELTRLQLREESVGRQTGIAATRPAEGGAAVTQEFLIALGQRQQELAEDVSRSHEKMQTWMPASGAGKEKNPLSEAQSQTGEAARLLHEAAISAATQQLDRAIEISTQAVAKLEDARTNILATTDNAASRPANAPPAGPSEIALFILHRTSELERLIVEENAAISKMQAIGQKRAGRAVGLEQIQIKLATADLADRVEKQLPRLQGMPVATVKKFKQALEVLQGEIPEEEQEAAIVLRAARWSLAVPHVAKAIDGYVRAEKFYDEALTIIEKVLADRAAKTPPQVGQPPSAQQLLDMLKREQENLDRLGFALPRLNLQIISDWAGNGDGSGGAGGRGPGGTAQKRNNPQQDQRKAEAQARAAKQEADRTREQAQRAHRDAATKRDRMLADAKKRAESRPAAAGTASGRRKTAPKAPDGPDFNIFVSKLDDDITQSRGTMPPSQYREAIRSYFESISEAATEK